ncbi:hypothetical protein GIB67_032396 [Kingdonia uniflora]|uniref:Target of Myb protein 1 n=1 Tax=Kingdonia uniflora TaxID=39325 RepID=A0A7J7MJ25_9MAGN|nr:hypothetical protein GIB67_032396 [Kingdonia uniflora]
MDKLKLGGLGERLKSSGSQMGKLVSGKVKEILQSQTPESKLVEEATLDHLEEANWGLNLRICGMLNSGEISGQEVVRAIKKKISSSKNPMSQILSLDLLEVCAMNCDKIFSEVASEKVVEEMVKMIDNPQTDGNARQRGFQLIRAWGESEDLAYLPVFRQTYESLKTRNTPHPLHENGRSAATVSSRVPDFDQQPFPHPDDYSIPNMGLQNVEHTAIAYRGSSFSPEERKEFLVVTRNSVELLSSMLNETEPKFVKDDLTSNMMEKCKQSQPVLQRIIESAGDDDEMLFEAFNLHDELQRVISKFEEMAAAVQLKEQTPESSRTPAIISPGQAERDDHADKTKSPKGHSSEGTDMKSTG